MKLRQDILFFLVIIFCSIYLRAEVLNKGNIMYLSNEVVIKLKPLPQLLKGQFPVLSTHIENYFNTIQTIEKISFIKINQKEGDDLSRIYILKYNSTKDPFIISEELKAFQEIEWAEPKFVYNITFDPNDSLYSTQASLMKIKANLAWDITKGDTNVVIAIIDTGVDWDHPDLAANIWHNKAEIPDNGVDDDGNGFVDDFNGWDLGGLNGTADNNPMEDRPDHGTHVAGIASGVTNNGTGISSIGYSCKIMPVKTSRDDVRNPQSVALVSFGFEGIIYAVNNNADIINCSWGGSGFSRLGQETINYAIQNGSLLVCAAGNDNENTAFYPASYEGAISVGSSDLNDTKSSYSNYGKDVDVMAPGASIISTWQDNTYILNSGTSMASPFAAGLSALIKSRFPTYTPLQIGEQLRATTDDIYNVNPSINFLLGKGRINALNAVLNVNAKSVRAVDVRFTDQAPGGNNDSIFTAGETLTINITFTNYLNPMSLLNITLQEMNNYSTIINGNFQIQNISTLETFNNSSAKFTFKLNDILPENVDLAFLLRFNDVTYTDFQWISTKANPNYITQSGGEVTLTLTSRGKLAFNDYPTNLEGDGFHYRTSSNVMFEGALLTGISNLNISDAARGTDASFQNNDFNPIAPFFIKPNIPDHTEGESVFNDNDAGGFRLGITVTLHSYSYPLPPLSNLILLRYTITNNNNAPLNNFFIGLFLDWDLIEGSGTGDVTSWDPINNFGYVYNTSGTPPFYLGSALMSQSGYNFWAIKNDGTDGGFSIYDNFTNAEKWQGLSSGIGKLTAGPADISHIISGGPYMINPGQTIETGFMIAGAPSLDSLRATVTNARTQFFKIIDVTPPIPKWTFQLLPNYPNPFNALTNITFSLPAKEHVVLKIFDILGNEVRTLLDAEREAGPHTIRFNGGSLSSGVYIYKIQAGSNISSRKLIFLK